MAKNDALLKQGREDFETCEDWWKDNAAKWLVDSKFCIPGGQWPEKLRKEREDAGLYCLEVDKLNQYVNQVKNDARQNRPGIKVRPVDDSGDIKAAQAFQGIIRDICDKSNADEAYDTAIEHAARGGFGYFRVLSQYVHEKTFLQELIVRRVRNPLSVRLGPHILADGSDADFGFCIEDVPKNEFKRRYPRAKIQDWKSLGFSGDWQSEKTVRVCEYYYKVRTPSLLHLLEDGTCVTDEEYEKAETEGGKLSPIKDSREIPTVKVKWCRMTGAEVLEENDWLGQYIPIVPVYGNESDIEGKVIVSGLIRGAKDSQLLHNFARTKFAERVALTPMAPWLIADEAAEGHPEWETANSGNWQALKWRSYSAEGQQLPQPSRISPTDVPAGFAQDAQMSEHDIQASMGMYAASVGQPSNEKSGRAIMARQREGDTATFHYIDNLNRAIRYLGRILVDAIPKYYDTKRIVRILGEDGVAQMATLDPSMGKASGMAGQMPIFNLNVGRFDVSVAAGPGYTTKRQEAADAMIELTRANPSMWATHGDLIVESQDWPNADKFAARSKLALPPPIQQALQAETQGKPPEVVQAQQMVQQIQQAAEAKVQEMGQMLEQAKGLIQQLQQDKSMEAEKLAIEARKAETQQYEAETERMTAIAPAITPEAISAIVRQTVTEIIAQPVPAAPPMKPPGEPPIVAAADEPPPGGFFTPEGA